jgi:N-methylhydantoinase A
VVLSAEQANNPTADVFKQLFEDDYKALFGRIVDGMDIEITVWAVNATTETLAVQRAEELNGVSEASIDSQRSMFDPALGEAKSAAVVLRDDMLAGQEVSGPAAIIEDETTVIVPASRKAIMQSDGCIDVRVRTH